MIKINLLPTKRKVSKKMTELQQQMVLGALILILAGIGIGYAWMHLNSLIAQRESLKAAAEAKIRDQENLLKEVKGVEEERKKVMDKIAIIEQLKKNQTGPVRLLDEVSRALPVGVNLTAMNERGGQVDVSGQAFTNDDVVRFVDNLKASPYLSDVFLLETTQTSLQGIEAYNYRLQFKFKGA